MNQYHRELKQYTPDPSDRSNPSESVWPRPTPRPVNFPFSSFQIAFALKIVDRMKIAIMNLLGPVAIFANGLWRGQYRTTPQELNLPKSGESPPTGSHFLFLATFPVDTSRFTKPISSPLGWVLICFKTQNLFFVANLNHYFCGHIIYGERFERFTEIIL